MTEEFDSTAEPPHPTAVFKPLRDKRAFEEVADRVREMLEDGALKVGDRLPAERELSKQLNVSRAILREALRTLENAGLLELRPGKLGGAFVSDGKPEAVSETMSDLLRLGAISLTHLTEARAWIEEVVVRVACERAEEEDFLALEANVKKAEELFAQGRIMEKLDANIEFHNILAAATKNPVLIMMTQALGGVMRSFAKRLGAETRRSVIRSRTKLIQLLRTRDADAAVAEMHEHLRSIHKVYMQFAKAKGMDKLATPTGPSIVAKSILEGKRSIVAPVKALTEADLPPEEAPAAKSTPPRKPRTRRSA